MKILIGIFVFYFSVMPFSAIANTSFNCKKAATEVEKEICSNQDLAKLDFIVGSKYNYLLKILDYEKKKSLQEQQRKWISSRESCSSQKKDVDLFFCIAVSFYSRIKEMDKITASQQWILYKNSKYGLQFLYPQDALIEEKNGHISFKMLEYFTIVATPGNCEVFAGVKRKINGTTFLQDKIGNSGVGTFDDGDYFWVSKQKLCYRITNGSRYQDPSNYDEGMPRLYANMKKQRAEESEKLASKIIASFEITPIYETK